MAFKIAVVLCLFGLAHAGNLYGRSGLGISSGLGYGNLGHRSAFDYKANLVSGLGHGASLGYGPGYVSGLGYGSNLGFSSLGHASNLGYSSFGHGSTFGYGNANLGLRHGASVGFNSLSSQGYGASAYTRPAVSTVSVTKYVGSATPYSGFSTQRSYAPTISGSYGHGGYGYGTGAYGNNW